MASLGKSLRRLSDLRVYSRRCPRARACLAIITPQWGIRIKPFSSSSARNTIFTSPIPDIKIKEESLSEYLLPKFEHFGNRTALVDDNAGKTYTYLEMREAVIKLGSALHRLGYRKGDVLCMCSTNNTEYALLILACVTSGIVLTTTNPAYTSGELARHLNHSSTSGVVVIESLLPTLQEAIESDVNLKTNIKNVIVVGEKDGYRSFSNLLDDDGTCFPDNLTFNPKEDVALLPYSSGTTGLPKGVMLSHRNIVSNLQQTRPQHVIKADDAVLCLLPMFHAYGMIFILLNTLQDGAKLVILPLFEPGSFLTSIQQHKVTILYMVPPVALFLARHPLVDKFDISNIRSHLCAAAPLGESLCREYEDRLKYPVVQGYGMTELSPVATIDTKPPHHIGTVGPLVPNSSAKVAPAELEDMLLGHPGVQDVAVIGMPDERAGEVPRAYIVPNPNGKVTREEISKFVEENSASHKHLRGGVEFLDEIPKSPSGKILRRILRDMS